MRTILLMTLVASAWLPIKVLAQQKLPSADDGQAAVPPLVYKSTFKGYLKPTQENDAPNKVWISVNRHVQIDDSVPVLNIKSPNPQFDLHNRSPDTDNHIRSKGQ